MSLRRWRLGVPVVLIALATGLTACQDEPSQPSPTRLPAAEPRPGPTGMPFSFEKRMKSQTIRKYPENFIC